MEKSGPIKQFIFVLLIWAVCLVIIQGPADAQITEADLYTSLDWKCVKANPDMNFQAGKIYPGEAYWYSGYDSTEAFKTKIISGTYKPGGLMDATGAKDRAGIDCSGFVTYVWDKAGSKLGTSTIVEYSRKITKEELQRGDILNSYDDHVIIFDQWADSAMNNLWVYHARVGNGNPNYNPTSNPNPGNMVAYEMLSWNTQIANASHNYIPRRKGATAPEFCNIDNNAIDVALKPTIAIQLNGPVKGETVTSDTVVFKKYEGGDPIEGDINYDEATKIISFIPKNSLESKKKYKIKLKKEILDIEGHELDVDRDKHVGGDGNYEVAFTTVDVLGTYLQLYSWNWQSIGECTAQSVPSSGPSAMAVSSTSPTLSGGDEQIDPGESFELTLALYNSGMDEITSASGQLNSSSLGVEITQASQFYGNIRASGEAQPANKFVFTVPADYTGRTIDFELYVTGFLSGQNYCDRIAFSLPVGSKLQCPPGASISEITNYGLYSIFTVDDEADGNNNGIFDIGDGKVNLVFYAGNSTSSDINAEFEIRVDDSVLAVNESRIKYASIPSFSYVEVPFSVSPKIGSPTDIRIAVAMKVAGKTVAHLYETRYGYVSWVKNKPMPTKPVAEQIPKVSSIVFNSDDKMYVLHARDNKIVKYDSDGTVMFTVKDFNGELLAYPLDVTYSEKYKKILVADTFNARILVYDENGNPVSKLEWPKAAQITKIARTHEDVLWGVIKTNYKTSIDQIDYGDAYLSMPAGIDTIDGENIYVSDMDSRKIFRYKLDSSGNLDAEPFTEEMDIDQLKSKMLAIEDYQKNYDEYNGGQSALRSGLAWGGGAIVLLGNPVGWAVAVASLFVGTVQEDSLTFQINYTGVENPGGGNVPLDVLATHNGFSYLQSMDGKLKKYDLRPTAVGDGIDSGSVSGGLKLPMGVEKEAYGNIWVADTGNARIVQFDAFGEFIREYKSDEYVVKPNKIKIRNGKLYIADTNHDHPLVWDISGEITNLKISDPWFSPNSDDVKDSLNLSYNISQPADITIQALPVTSGEVRVSSIKGAVVLDNVQRSPSYNQEVWSGSLVDSSALSVGDDNQRVIADGKYTLKLTAAFGDYMKSKTEEIIVDTEKPALALNRDPPAISPNGDSIKDKLLVDYSISDNLSPTAEVKLLLWHAGSVVDLLLDEDQPLSVADSLVWNGQIGNYLLEGEYVLELLVTDLAGNTASATAEVLVDAQPPRIESVNLSNEYFSPNGDGRKDDTEISFNLNDSYSEKMAVTVQVENESGELVTKIIEREELTPGEHSFTWEAMVGEGNYTIRIYAEDEAGNLGTSEPAAVVVDITPPTIESFAADPNPFSPNNDGSKDTTEFAYLLSEPCYAELRIFRDDNSALFRDHRLYNVTEGNFEWDGSGVHGEILGQEHPYYLYAEDRAGNITTSETQTIIVQHEPSLVPYAFADPDPFAPVNPNNDTTQIKYYLTRDNLMVTVEVIGKEGRLVKNLINGESQNKGEHSVSWNGDYEPSYDGPSVGNRVADGSWEFKVIASASDEPNPANTANTVLVDNVPPYILADPVNVDIVNRSATLQYSLPETSSLEVAVYDNNDNLIDEIEHTAAKSPGIYSASWQPAGDVNGLTYFKISAVDKALNQTEKITELFSVVPQEELQINNAYASPSPFTPNGDGLTDFTRIGYQISGGAPEYTVSISILTETGATLKRLVDNEPQSPGTYSFYWDGLSDTKQITADGNYRYEIIVEDKLGTVVEKEGGILVVSTRPSLNLTISPNIISPNGDGSSDILSIDYSVAYPMQYITGDALVKLEVINSSTSEALWSRVINNTAGSYSFQYDGTMTNGASLPAGSYYLKGTAQDALGAIAVPKMMAFEVDYTQPAPSDFTITPLYAKLGATVEIALEFQEELQDDPIVTIVGIGEASLESVSGNNYLYSYIVDADDSEGVATVSVVAQDLALNTITRTDTFVIDKTDPQVSNISIDPNPAKETEVTIGFDVNEALSETPNVYITQNGAPSQMAIVSGNYEAKYNVITGYDGPAQVTIEVLDLAENVTSYSLLDPLNIDTTAPVFTNIRSEITSNPDFSTYAKEGSEVSISFNTSEDLQFNPEVKVNGNLASYNSLISNEYKYDYTVTDTDTEGNAAITISGHDPAGNEGTAETSSSSESFVIDLINPTVKISGDPGMIANPSPFSTNASSEAGHRQTRLQYETSEYGYVTVNIHRIPNTQETYAREDFNNGNLVISFNESWLSGGVHYKYWNGAIQNNQAEYDKNSNGYADPGKYAFIVEVKDKAGNLIEGKWGGTCWIQDNVLDLIEPDQTALGHDNPQPQYFSPNGDGSLEATEVFFRVRLGVSPAEPATPEAIGVFGIPTDFQWLDGVVKTVGTYTVRVFDETKINLKRTIVSDAPLYSNTILSETWDGKDDDGQYVAEGTYKIEIDARDYIGGQAENNLLTLTATVDVSAPQIVSNEPDQAGTPWANTGKSYDVDFFENQNAYASKLKKAEYNVHYPSGGESGWITLFQNQNLSSYTDNWGGSIFDDCEDGINTVEVRAVDNAGNEAVQHDLFYVKRDVQKPSANAPTTTTPTNNNRPTWGWTASSDMSGIEGYYIKLGTFTGGGNIVGETWIGNTTSWQTTTNLGNGTYYATVKAKDNAGNVGDWGSSGSVSVDITPPVISGISDSPDPFSPGNIDGNKDSITFYYTVNETSTVTIYVDGSSKYNVVEGAGSHSYLWAPGTSIGPGAHTYSIRAVDGVGNVSTSSNYGFTVDNTPLPAPTGLAATSGNGVVNLVWNSVSDSQGYNIYRASAYNGTYSKVSGPVSGTTYQDIGRSNGVGYWYKVASVDLAGNDGLSDYVFARPGILSQAKIYFLRWFNPWHKMDSDGSNIGPIGRGGFNTIAGAKSAISHDGSKVVFPVSPNQPIPAGIYTLDIDGTGPTRLTTNDWDYISEPSFSPDRSKIVFHKYQTASGVFVVDADGNNETRISDGGYASFSPDGQKIVFNKNDDIYIMDKAGGNEQQITSLGDCRSPWFSPDGSKIAFERFSSGIWRINKDGNGLVQLCGPRAYRPRYSPDGTKIAYCREVLYQSGGWQNYVYDICVMDADGSNQMNLTQNENDEEECPIWTPFIANMSVFSVRNETIVQAATLEVPILSSPDDQASVNNIRPIFEWQHRKGDTQEYKIDLAKNSSFAIDHQTFTKAPNTGLVDKDDPTLYHYTYSIHEFDPGLDRDTYYWKVTAASTSESATSEVRSFTVAPQLTLTGVTNYPNPFNPNRETTNIRYRLGADVDAVKIRIYDVVGSLVKEITNCPTNGEGSSVWDKYQDVDWDGRNGRGDLVRNGIYPFEITARLGDKSVSARGKIAVLK